jgi:hypothetical protein
LHDFVISTSEFSAIAVKMLNFVFGFVRDDSPLSLKNKAKQLYSLSQGKILVCFRLPFNCAGPYLDLFHNKPKIESVAECTRKLTHYRESSAFRKSSAWEIQFPRFSSYPALF